MRSLEELEKQYGECLELLTPCGYKVVIRQQNGEDDDILSLHRDAANGSAINKFIASIVVSTDFIDKGRLTLSNVLDMKLRDKYFILIASRIFSIGQILKFDYQWEDLKEPTAYEEDLALYIWDYNTPFPSKQELSYFESRIQPQIHGKEVYHELGLTSGKHLRYTHMDGRGERVLLDTPLEEQTKNLELLARDLHELINDNWVKVQNFKTFSPADMREIRNDVFEVNDPVLSIFTELTHPNDSNIKTYYPILGSNDFFYPREV